MESGEMRKRFRSLLGAAVLAIMASSSANAHDFPMGENQPFPPSRGNGPMIYVTAQALVYDSIVLTDLPFKDDIPFQKLEMGGPTGLQTEFGPGDTGYVGGRWWMDTNTNDVMDPDDHYFMCPLLGPGYTM
jgi:hypothetical protein